MLYQERLAERKRLFGRVLESLSENGNPTTMPAPFAYEYTRGYWPRQHGMVDATLLPHEKKLNPLMLRKFEY